MIVYVETNFPLELAYRQPRWESCREILNLSIASRIAVVIPAFSAIEARVTLKRRASGRQDLQTRLETEIREISRSEAFRTLRNDSRDVVAALVAGSEDSRIRLEEAIIDIKNHGRVIPLTAEIIDMARYYEITHSLSPPDAVVLASVTTDASSHSDEKIFVTQDVKAFSSPRVQNELPEDCKILTNFTDALAYINARTAG